MNTKSHEINYFHYASDALSRFALDFFPVEKLAKVSYRVIDLAGIFCNNFPESMVRLSSEIKDLILSIESTRFFCVSYPVLVPDSSGRTFFQTKTLLQCAEKLAIVTHLALKTLFGAERAGLIQLGIVSSFAIGNLTAFKWAIEGTILLYNLFGACEGSIALKNAYDRKTIVQGKIEKWHNRKIAAQALFQKSGYTADLEHTSLKERKWEVNKQKLQFECRKAWFKIGATVSKFVLIVFAVGIAAVNIWNVPCHITILVLGIVSDSIGLAGFFHNEYMQN